MDAVRMSECVGTKSVLFGDRSSRFVLGRRDTQLNNRDKREEVWHSRRELTEK